MANILVTFPIQAPLQPRELTQRTAVSWEPHLKPASVTATSPNVELKDGPEHGGLGCLTL